MESSCYNFKAGFVFEENETNFTHCEYAEERQTKILTIFSNISLYFECKFSILPFIYMVQIN